MQKMMLALKVLLVAVVLGPLIGGIVFYLLIKILGVLTFGLSPMSSASEIISVGLLLVPYSYVMGMLPAFVAGIIAMVFVLTKGTLSFFASCLSALFGVLSVAFFSWEIDSIDYLVGKVSAGSNSSFALILLFFGVPIISGGLLWGMFRKFLLQNDSDPTVNLG